jgi:hypothetical protein
MIALPALAAMALWQPVTDEAQVAAFVSTVRSTAKTASYASLRKLFTSPSNTQYLEAMIGPQSSLKNIGVDACPAPPGFEKFGSHWVIFHRYQEIESHHDVVVPVVRTGEGLSLGAEIPEDLAVPYRFAHLKFKVRLLPEERRAEISTTCEVKRAGEGPSTLVMRLNDAYALSGASYAGSPVAVLSGDTVQTKLDPKQRQLVRCGGLLYLTNAGNGGSLELKYAASLDIRGLDKTTADLALLTSYWYPHIGRQPVTSETEIEGPKDWLLLGNGNLVSEQLFPERKRCSFKSDVPLCWFHVVGGPYKLAAEVSDRGRKFRAWHLGAVDTARGKHDAEMARDAVAFYEDRLGKFPFNGYDVVDTPDFYGVECYSFTVLTPRITMWATSHEIGHTYFGGLVPNTYIKSIWNEGLTQYIDSIAFKKNSDRTLEGGYQSRKAPVSLADSFLAHGPYGNVGYMRGAYVFKMLENELGTDQLNLCLRRLIIDRQGKSTEWSDIERSFSATAGRPLSWFFDQWVRGKSFPTISIARAFGEPGPRGGFNTHVDFLQTGTQGPFKLKFEVIVVAEGGERRQIVSMDSQTGSCDIETPTRPIRVMINALGWTLSDVPAPYQVNVQDLAVR